MLRQFQHTLKLENNGRLFAMFPLTICHIIDSSSPLYDLSAKDLLEKKYDRRWGAAILFQTHNRFNCRFEIVVTLTGGSRSTGQLTQERTSYLPREIMWGHRFINIVEYDRRSAVYVADYDQFDSTESVSKRPESHSNLIDVISLRRRSTHHCAVPSDWKKWSKKFEHSSNICRQKRPRACRVSRI